MVQLEADVEGIVAVERASIASLADDPRSTDSWEAASEYQRRLAIDLNEIMSEHGVVLHDRLVPGTRERIDHLVVGQTGVWVISSITGREVVERRDGRIGAERGPQLYVAGENRTSLVVDMDWLVGSIRRALEPIGFGGVPITAVICFSDPDCWMATDESFQIGKVWVAAPNIATELVRGPASFTDEAIESVVRHLDRELSIV